MAFHYGVKIMASRGQDVVDIFEATWQTPPNAPDVFLEIKDKTPMSFFKRPPADGVIVVKKSYIDEYERLSFRQENQVWTYKTVIIAKTDAKLELMIRQGKEVLDRYTDVPFATATNGNTYHFARLMNGETRPEISSWVYDGEVQLANFTVDVVIA